VLVGSIVVLNINSRGIYRIDLPEDTRPLLIGNIRIGGDTFSFNPKEIVTIRPDIFNPGYFSMFDILVHLDNKGIINMGYHFNQSLNTYIIDSINGEPYWWYEAFYDGGWRETNVFRPDHYPWKDGTTLTFFRTNRERLEAIYSVWKTEIRRLNTNGGKIVIPLVIIKRAQHANFTKYTFHNVEVSAHNLRKDIFKDDVITALDVIMSLGDQEKITYELMWYESIGSAGIVKNYWVESINGHKSFLRCGWVYEAGSPTFNLFRGNHIHLPSDIRVLNSPVYVEFFWLCI
jgi:hypothetical protein